MALSAGTRLGAYEVLTQIGAGGMGEVYQARDTKLGRDVAIKVLPEAFAHDPDRLSRFQREAKMLASLNHPNIATIHGLEQSGGTSYLVMELVPGETLAERIQRDGPVPIEEALAIAKQIAEALEAAHEKAIIHRDLKPANVKVTPEGKVKVLDFGLAKAYAGDRETYDPTNSPTLSAAATMQGMILGTAAYMSPEQARGKSVDKRSDIWAFGCVVYELLTGKHAFDGEDITEILAAVVKTEPDWNHLPTTTPPTIRMLLKRCLQKDRTIRLRDAGDARIEIHEALLAPTSLGAISAPPGTKYWRQLLPWASGLILSVVVGVAIWNLKAPSPQPVTRTVINLPLGQQLAGLESGPAVALSPDGTYLVYVANQGGTQQLYLRAMDSLETRPIPGTEGAVNPFFSPDGQWLGFFAGQELKKVAVSGGAAITLGAVAFPRGANWGSQAMIAFTGTTSGALQQVSEAGGTPQPLTRLDKGEASQRWPEFLPGGKAVLFSGGASNTNWVSAQIVVQSVGTSERRNLIQGATHPRYALPGHLV
jgi:serine/threonine protein kinase